MTDQREARPEPSSPWPPGAATPGGRGEPERANVTVAVSPELLEQMNGWSPPLRIRIDPNPYPTLHPTASHEMTCVSLHADQELVDQLRQLHVTEDPTDALGRAIELLEQLTDTEVE